MAIQIRCFTCGQQYGIKEELSGKRVKCSCGNILLVPDAATGAISSPGSVAGGPSTDPATTPTGTAPRTVASRMWLILGLSIGGIVCIAVALVVVSINSGNGSGSHTADQDGGIWNDDHADPSATHATWNCRPDPGIPYEMHEYEKTFEDTPLSREGRFAWFRDKASSVVVVDFASGEEVGRITQPEVRAAVDHILSPDGYFLITYERDKHRPEISIKVWSVVEDNLHHEVSLPNADVDDPAIRGGFVAAVTPTLSIFDANPPLAAVQGANTIRFYNLQSGQFVWGTPNRKRVFASPGSRYVASFHMSDTVNSIGLQFHELENGEPAGYIRFPTVSHSHTPTGFSPDGTKLGILRNERVDFVTEAGLHRSRLQLHLDWWDMTTGKLAGSYKVDDEIDLRLLFFRWMANDMCVIDNHFVLDPGTGAFVGTLPFHRDRLGNTPVRVVDGELLVVNEGLTLGQGRKGHCRSIRFRQDMVVPVVEHGY